MPIERKAAVLIPARWASSRFPGKPLAKILGKPMIQWVVESASRAETVARVIVATDDDRILDLVRGFGGEAVMTAEHHPSGSDRIAEVAAGLDCDIIVNVQGDEPLMPPGNIDQVVRCLEQNRSVGAATLMMPLESSDEALDPNIVKVVTNLRGEALYFSRSPIPCNRDRWGGEAINRLDVRNIPSGNGDMFKHVGIYGYRRPFLMEFTRMPPTPLEQLEKLEQLRILENGYAIQVARAEGRSIGVDRVEDLEKIENLLLKEAAGPA